MKQLQDHHMREIEIYKRELSVWFKERREEQERSRMLEDHTAEEKYKVNNLGCGLWGYVDANQASQVYTKTYMLMVIRFYHDVPLVGTRASVTARTRASNP